jgi:tetratricopeptide (TPR) repeat protein
VSQLFDSLRRGRHSSSPAKSPRTAQGDAVLATLGYAPVRRSDGRRSATIRLLLIGGVMALCWAGWRLYAGRQPQPASSTSTAASRPAAAARFRTALQLDPGDVDALVSLALAQRDGRQLEAAKETLRAALTRSPRNAAAHYNLAQLYDQTNEVARAADHYRKFLEYAGTEYASHAAAVRLRIEALSRNPE